jgi:SNF family Na+-dependent transporter
MNIGFISYFTSTLPYLMITILIIRGALLLGADKGIEFYVGSFDISKLADANLWKDAVI